MKLVVLCPELGLPSTRIRWERMLPHLEEFDGSVRAFPSTMTERERLRAELDASALVVVHRKLPSDDEARFLTSLAAPRVFDFDDAVMFRKRRRWGSYRSRRAEAAFERALATCDAATPGNRFLAERCAGHVASVLVTPSAVPVDVPRVAPLSPGEPLRVGWVGLSDNFRYLRPMRPVLRRLASRHDFVFTVISDRDLEWRACAVENRRWSLAEQERLVAELDVGIMPLANSPWTRGKCAYKLLQSMAAGAAVVGSRVGTNVDVVEDGRDGFLASGRAEWTRKLERLLTEPELRARLGAQAVRTARRYSYPAVAAELGPFLARVAARRPLPSVNPGDPVIPGGPGGPGDPPPDLPPLDGPIGPG